MLHCCKKWCMLTLYPTSSREACPSYETTFKAPPHYGSATAHTSSHSHLPTWERDFRNIRDTAERESIMPPLILLFLALALFACALGLTILRNTRNRADEKRRNQYHDRV